MTTLNTQEDADHRHGCRDRPEQLSTQPGQDAKEGQDARPQACHERPRLRIATQLTGPPLARLAIVPRSAVRDEVSPLSRLAAGRVRCGVRFGASTDRPLDQPAPPRRVGLIP
jgi:hypothetical protein